LQRRLDFFRDEGIDFQVDVRVNVVPSCHSCNSILSDRLFRTLEDRRAVKESLLRKYYHLLFETPDWTDEELAELGHTLHWSVVARQRLKSKVKRRLAWPRVNATDAVRPPVRLVASREAADKPIRRAAALRALRQSDFELANGRYFTKRCNSRARLHSAGG
jgi:hypothetical protein